MSNWGQIIDGRVCNAVTVDPTTIFTAEWLEKNEPFQTIPDGIVSGATVVGGVFTNPPAPTPVFKVLTGTEFLNLCAAVFGFARLDQLLAKSKSVETLILKAPTIGRDYESTLAVIDFLKTGANALTNQELAALDAAWLSLDQT